MSTWPDGLKVGPIGAWPGGAVDRYGVTKRGEQYRGFLALEASAASEGFGTAHEAWAYLMEVATGARDVSRVENVERGGIALALRSAQRKAHPDRGGDPAVFARVSLAEARLRAKGLL